MCGADRGLRAGHKVGRFGRGRCLPISPAAKPSSPAKFRPQPLAGGVSALRVDGNGGSGTSRSRQATFRSVPRRGRFWGVWYPRGHAGVGGGLSRRRTSPGGAPSSSAAPSSASSPGGWRSTIPVDGLLLRQPLPRAPALESLSCTSSRVRRSASRPQPPTRQRFPSDLSPTSHRRRGRRRFNKWG